MVASAIWFGSLALPVAAETVVTRTDSFIMGAGRWTCEEVLGTLQSGDAGRRGEVAGWLLGVWSRATTERSTAFTDIVEKVGGQGIFEATVAECRRAPGSTLLYRVTYEMIDNTAPGQ